MEQEELLQKKNLVAGMRQRGVTYSLDFHTHEQHELLLLHGGNCRFLVGNQLYYLQPGNLLMLDGMTVHRAYVYGDPEAYERSIVRFQAEWLRPLLKELKLEYLLDLFTENRNGIIRTFQKRDEDRIERIMKELAYLYELEDNDLNDARRKLTLAHLLIQISVSTEKIIHKEEMPRDEQTEIAERTTNFLFTHYREPLTVDDVARAVNLSKSYLSHVFKSVTGYTIMNYLMSYRLSQARNQLLAERQKPIKQVSFENGFESEAHFSRYFKQNFGVSPSQYRKEQINLMGEGESE